MEGPTCPRLRVRVSWVGTEGGRALPGVETPSEGKYEDVLDSTVSLFERVRRRGFRSRQSEVSDTGEEGNPVATDRHGQGIVPHNEP